MEKTPLTAPKMVFVCTHERPPGEKESCGPRGGAEIRDRLKEMVKERGLDLFIRVSKSGCMDRCGQGPMVMVFPDNVCYSNVSVDDLPALLEELSAEFDF